MGSSRAGRTENSWRLADSIHSSTKNIAEMLLYILPMGIVIATSEIKKT